MHGFCTPPLYRYFKRLPLQLIKGYGIYINFVNFTFKVDGKCKAQFIAFPGQQDKTNKKKKKKKKEKKKKIFLTNYFSFDDVSLKSDVKLAQICVIRNCRQWDKISFKPLEFTFCIMEFSRFSQEANMFECRI